MTHTLTAFMELMDHGIVSWENLSSVFIKKVLDLSPVLLRFSALPSSSHTRRGFLLTFPDCRLRQRQTHRCLDTAGVLGHPGEHGAE